MNLPRVFSKLLIGTALILSSSSVFAGIFTGTITFTPVDPTAVPTLSGWMLIVLSVLLFAVAVKASRQNGNGAGKFFLILMSVGILGSGTGGVKLLSDVQAGQFNQVPVDSDNFLDIIAEREDVNLPGGTFNLFPANAFVNKSSQPFNFTIQPLTGSEEDGELSFVCGFQVLTSEEFNALFSLNLAIEGEAFGPSQESFTLENSGVLPSGQLLLTNCIPSSFQAGE